MPAMLATAIVHELNDLLRSINGRGTGLGSAEFLSVEMLRFVFPGLHRFSLRYFLGERPVAVGAEEAHFAIAFRLAIPPNLPGSEALGAANFTPTHDKKKGRRYIVSFTL